MLKQISVADDLLFEPKFSPVLGILDVAAGAKVIVPTTIYEVGGDDTSGVAGLLFPNGEFIAKAIKPATQRYWEFDETDRYVTTRDGRVVGDSWRDAPVIWSADAAPIAHQVEMRTDVFVEVTQKTKTNAAGDVTNSPYVVSRLEDVVVNIREKDTNALTGDWVTTGELWRSLERGTAMQGGRVPGKVHGRDE